MDYMNRTGPHSLRHPKPAMNWYLAAVKKGASTDASAKMLHSNVLLCVSVKANVQGTDCIIAKGSFNL